MIASSLYLFQEWTVWVWHPTLLFPGVYSNPPHAFLLQEDYMAMDYANSSWCTACVYMCRVHTGRVLTWKVIYHARFVQGRALWRLLLNNYSNYLLFHKPLFYFILVYFLALWLLKMYIFCTFNTEFISKTFDHFCTHKGYNLSCSLCSKIIKVKELTHNPNSNLSQQTCFLIYLFFVWLYCCFFFFFVAVPLRIVRLSFPSHLAWNTRPKAPSPMSRTYSMLLRGYSSVRSLELSSRGRRWYMGFGWSLSSSSSEGRAVRVGTSMALLRTHNRSQTERARKSLTSCVETNHSVCLPDHYLCLFFLPKL